MKNLIRLCVALVATWLSMIGTNAAQTNVTLTIFVRAIDSGYYDRYGERDTRIKAAVAGFSAQAHPRGPFRSFAAFEIPNFPGTVTSASLFADVYSISPDGGETLELRSVTSPVSAVRDGGLGLTGIYADLGEGIFFGSVSYSSGYHYGQTIPLNANAVAAVNDARGEEFAFGGALASANSDPIYDEVVDLLSQTPDRIQLRLEATVPVEPIIFTQPPGRGPLIYSNAAFFTVGACGAPSLTYYWFVDGVTGGPRSQPDFYMQSLTTTPQSVFVVVSNSFGTVTSVVSQVRARPAQFNSQFTNVTVRVGDFVVLNPFLAVLSFPFTVEWRRNGIPFSAPNPYSHQFNSIQLSDSGDYTVVVSNSFGVATSAVMRLEVVETPPVFWQEPFDQNAPYGSAIYLSAEVKAGPPAVLRWYRVGSPAPVTMDDFLFFPSLSESETGQYYVVASNYLGMATSHVATVTGFSDPPVFTIQPRSQVAYPGTTVRLEGRADGHPLAVYQWYFNGAPIFERAPQLWLFNVSSNEAGSYYLVASNSSGTATSQVATVIVSYLPPVLSGPDDATIGEGYSVSLPLLVSNPPVHIRWQHNGTSIPGSDSVFSGNFPTYMNFFVNASDTNKAGFYSAIASNAYGFSTSRVATLTVTSYPPTVVLFPLVSAVLEGEKVDFYAFAGGAPPPQLSLYRNGTYVGTMIPNQNFTLPAVTLEDRGDYVAIASNRVGIATSAVARLDVQRAGPLDRWNVRSPIPQGNDLFAVAYGAGKFVAVGRNGAIISSSDGTNWSNHSLRTTAEINDVTYGGGRFVAAGEGSLLVTSTNGENWSVIPMAPSIEFSAITYGNGRFVAVGRPNFVASPTVFISTNGIDWADSSFLTPSASWLRAVAYGANSLVAFDVSGQALRSTDFANWSITANSLFNTEILRFLAGGFISVGNNGFVAKSPDGITWTTNYINPLRLYDVAHGSGQFVAVGARGFVSRSSDAIIWSNVPPPTAHRLEGVTYGNNLFVAVGERGTILTSSNGQAWANHVRVTAEDLDGMTVGGGLAVVVGKNDTILTSPNGLDRTRALVPPATNGLPRDWHGVGYGDGKFVVVGQTKDILVSTNGVDWELRGYETPVFNPYLKSVTYAAGVWVAVGEQGELISSPDAIAWLPFDSTVVYDLNEVVYGNGMFVVVGDRFPGPSATILTSTNGTNWFNRSVFTGKNARGITFANGLFVVTLNDGRIMYGSDPAALNWSHVVTPVAGDGNNLRGITWSNGLWVAVGNEGLLLTSTNAANWKKRVTPTEENLHAVRYINGTFVAVGNAGTILQSDPLVSRLAAELMGADLRLTLSSPYEGILKLQYANEFMPFPPANPWQDLAFITNVVGTVDFTVPLPAGAGHRFYRVVPP
jgi:hypothetical protein